MERTGTLEQEKAPMLTSLEHGRSSSRKGESKSAEVFLLSRGQIEHYWPQIEGELDAAPELWQSWFSKEGLFARMLDKMIQVWTVCEAEGPICAVFLTQILVTDTGKVLYVFWMRGHLLDGALKCISLSLDRFAAHYECSRITIMGRKGWERKLQGLGMTFEGVLLSRPVYPTARN
jgi:hypothetical protein